jgi:hypothetical protein
MIRHELSQWPLVISISSGLQTLESMAPSPRTGTDGSRGEPFASLRVFADADALHPEGSAQRAKQWLQARGEESADDGHGERGARRAIRENPR